MSLNEDLEGLSCCISKDRIDALAHAEGPHVMTGAKLREIQVHVFARPIMIRPLVAPLEDGPYPFDVVGVGLSPDILTGRVPDGLVFVVAGEVEVAGVLVGEQARPFDYVGAHKVDERVCVHRGDVTHTDSTSASSLDHTQDGSLVASRHFLVPVLVFL